MVRRIFWRSIYPFASVANRVCGLSYKWVNVGIGAWHREYFDALWHHERYGDEIGEMPAKVNLCGFMFDVTVREGMVLFTNYDVSTRLVFERDPHDCHGMLWYFEGSQRVAATHVDKAYRWIRPVFGGLHDLKRPAL